jgi:hypothetical protein
MKLWLPDMIVNPSSFKALIRDGSAPCYKTDNRKMGRSLDDTAKSTSSREHESSAFNMFRNMDRKGSAKAGTEDTSLPTFHQNTITYDHH